MRSGSNRAAPGLILAARQLRNDRLVRLFESFLEYRACVGRVIVQTIVALWCFGWLYGPQPVLVRDAQAVFPTAATLWMVAVVWMVLVRRRIIPPGEWLDAIGFAMNLLFIGIQTYLAFILLMSLNAFLPFITIAAVARYGQKATLPVLLSTFVLMLLTAPAGYWLSRPAYFVYAVALSVVLPLLVARIVSAMQEIALQALAARDAQSRFISTMNHELRTPLNAVINCAQLIDSDTLSAQQRELMQAVTVNAIALRHRVNEVIDVASIDGGRLQLHSKPLSLLDVLATVKAVCASAASTKGVALALRSDAAQTPDLIGDEGRIEQVITNLVINAIKFTPAGGAVDVLIAATQVQQRWAIAVTVTDTGIGIPDAQKAYIFTPFTQLSTGFSRAEGGVGLGLFHCAVGVRGDGRQPERARQPRRRQRISLDLRTGRRRGARLPPAGAARGPATACRDGAAAALPGVRGHGHQSAGDRQSAHPRRAPGELSQRWQQRGAAHPRGGAGPGVPRPAHARHLGLGRAGGGARGDRRAAANHRADRRHPHRFDARGHRGRRGRLSVQTDQRAPIAGHPRRACHPCNRLT